MSCQEGKDCKQPFWWPKMLLLILMDVYKICNMNLANILQKLQTTDRTSFLSAEAQRWFYLVWLLHSSDMFLLWTVEFCIPGSWRRMVCSIWKTLIGCTTVSLFQHFNLEPAAHWTESLIRTNNKKVKRTINPA